MAVLTSKPGTQMRGRPLMVGVLLLAMLPAALDQTALSPALPAIGAEFRGGLGYDSWVICAYLLAMTASVMLWGRLGDQFGHKSLLIAALLIFLIGSVLSGLAWDLDSLNVFRAVQGLGAGGLVVLSQVIAGDLVPPHRRGRYQGLFGAVFGVATIVGSLFGALFVDHLSWRWIMLINLPIAVVTMALAAIVLPAPVELEKHRIDYLGPALLAGSVGLIMVTTVGVIQHSWTSVRAVEVGSVAVALGIGWALTQRRAAEPTLPLNLFRNPVFSIGGTIDFIAGFVLFGSLIYVPVFLQVVTGRSAGVSGLYLLPLILGVLVMAIVSGHLISRTGRYKALLVTGMALTTLGLLLCSRLETTTATLAISLALGVLGCGLGLVVQVPIIAVQNAVDYRRLGVGTSGVTMCRAVGGVMGITVFSAILGHQIAARMAEAVRAVQLPPEVDIAAIRQDPRLLSMLPPGTRATVSDAFAHSFQIMFLWSVPVAFAGVLLALLLRGTAARTTANVSDLGEACGAVPTVRSSECEIERQLSALLRSDADTTEKLEQTYADLGEHAGTDAAPGCLWILCRVARAGSIPADLLYEGTGAAAEEGRRYVNRLVADGLLARQNGNLAITTEGQALAERLQTCMQRTLTKFLDGWSTEEFPQLSEHLARLSRQFLGDDAQQHILKPRAAT
ncbi:MDR family MFS transporter [Actinomadura sp. HBU206391]|uniref:MDR family MFS transporter n=1 Tax=Actinomadura sp. HBU206391 TaxID=2731692 RepID=UPI00164F0FC0|nr:MDR family MFS transporter [Actinomadura sp. HBU206391]MBC6460146.1 MFS transporter [Actinomadura sp. HBU206391]